MTEVKPHATATRERLYRSQRIALMGGAAEEFKFSDLSDYGLKPVTIERIYPQTLEAKVKFISTTINENSGNTTNTNSGGVPQIAKIISPALADGILDACIFDGNPEIDPDNGRNSIVPNDDCITGYVEAVNGDPDGNGYVLFGFTHSSDDGVLLITDNSRVIRYKDSEIILKEGEITINTPKLVINGVDVTSKLNGGIT